MTVKISVDVTEGSLVAWAVMVTVPALGTVAGGVKEVTIVIPAGSVYGGIGPLVVWVGVNVPHDVSTTPGASVPGGSALLQVTVQSTPRY